MGLLSVLYPPNFFRYIIEFFVLYSQMEVQPSILLFQALFILKKYPYADWLYVFSQRGVTFLISGALSSIHGWKSHFFFISCTLIDDWELSDWGWIEASSLKSVELSAKEQKELRDLLDHNTPHLDELLSDESFFSTELSSSESRSEWDRLCFIYIYIYI